MIRESSLALLPHNLLAFKKVPTIVIVFFLPVLSACVRNQVPVAVRANVARIAAAKLAAAKLAARAHAAAAASSASSSASHDSATATAAETGNVTL